MAFFKFANASLVKPAISMPAWDEVRGKALALGPVFSNKTASKILLQKFDPDQFLLSHCTIVASVDVEDTKTVLGRQMVDNFEVDRRYSDYFVTTGTSKYINNNFDGFERQLLLSTFRSFIGGENYVEHCQILELSKGKIIDAAVRDIGDSVYVDILVATDLKHKALIKAIQSKKLQTLSMGAQVAFTICSKCGNVAEDETQLCPHVKYLKGNTFFDGLGKLRKICELCGHFSDPKSCKFIEASWVANPAFTGAVLRNVLTPQEAALYEKRIQVAFSQPAKVIDPSMLQKAASSRKAQQDFDTGPVDETTEDSPKPAEKDPLDIAIEDLSSYLREKVVEKVRSQMSGTPLRVDLKENLNNNLIKEASNNPYWRRIASLVETKAPNSRVASHLLFGLMLFKSGGWKAVQASGKFSGRDVLAVSRLLDSFEGVRIAGETRIYHSVLAVGGMTPYQDVNSYLAACRRVIGRDLTTSEKDALVSKGRLYDLGS